MKTVFPAFGHSTQASAAKAPAETICGALVSRLAGPQADTVQFSGVFSRKPQPQKELNKALGRGDIAAAQKWLDEGAEINGSDKYGETALGAAAYSGKVSVVDFVLDRGGDPNRRNSSGRHMLAQLMGDTFIQEKPWVLDIVKTLIPVSHLNAQDDQGWTPINLAVKNGYVKEAYALIDAGADVQIRENKQKMTPLMHAAWVGDGDLAHAIIKAVPFAERREYVNAKNVYNRTAMNIAQGLGRKNMLSVLFPYSPLGTAGLPGGPDDPNRPPDDGIEGLDGVDPEDDVPPTPEPGDE